MHRFWEPLLQPLFERLQPRVIVEIGSDYGLNTRNLLHFCRQSGAVLHVIDPLPKYEVDEWLEHYQDCLEFHRAPSLDVLDSFENVDAVLIDGDHNWYTVFNELKTLESHAMAAAGRFPVVLLHDVGWPYGRRDLYYEPDRIPTSDRHPYAKRGIRPGQEDLDLNGGLNAHLFNAVYEGGPRNGVLTGVEDFLAETDLAVELEVVPGISGLGILYPTALKSSNRPIVEMIERLRASSELRGVLQRVEGERVISQTDALDRQRDLAEVESSLREQTERLRSVEQDAAAKGSEIERLQGELAKVRESARIEREKAEATVARVRDELEAANTELEEASQEITATQVRNKTLEKELAASNRRYRSLRSRRSVRLALSIARAGRPLLEPIRVIRKQLAKQPSESGDSREAGWARRLVGRWRQRRLVRAVRRWRRGSLRTDGPLISIVVLTRDGFEHLERLLPKLETTTYRSFELIVVDNGSTDGTREFLEKPRPFPIQVIHNDRNVSFSKGNNQGAEVAEGDYLLLLNNDIEPVNPGWLGAMLEAVEDEGVVACGALLVYPAREDTESDLTVQHSGICFYLRRNGVRPINLSAPDPMAAELSGISEVPAATAAALLVRTESFNQVGGFSHGYVYGTEDVDLCLRLRDLGGRIAVTGQAVLFHHESATQNKAAPEITQINRQINRQLLMETWGPRLTRSVQRDRIDGTGRWAGEGQRTVAITLTQDDPGKGWGDYYTAHELGDAFSEIGWNVIYAERYEDHWYDIGGDVDLVISLLDSYDVRKSPAGAFTVAWVRNWVHRWAEHPWIGKYDLVITSSHAAAQVLSRISRFNPAVVPLATNPARFHPGPPNPTFECEYAFTGNNWGQGREIIPLIDVHPGERFLLFGKNWDKDPRTERYWRGHLDYEWLPELYRSAKVILDDTAGPTRPHAFLNGRVFDALAAGALVITDNVEGSKEMFDGALPTYTNRRDLRAQLDHFLSNEGDRIELVQHLREKVLAHHSYAQRPKEILRLVRHQIELPKAAIKIGVPIEEEKPNWGDTHFGEALASALTESGIPTQVHILPEWDLPENQAVDIVIHIRGLSSYAPKQAHVNVLWIISHPDDVSARECEKYDLVMVASLPYAEWLKTQIETPVVFMPQATDERRFHPVEPDPDIEAEVLFVGNSRGQDRPAVDWAASRDLPLTVYGKGWDGRLKPGQLRAEYFRNDELATLYASAKVVLNDHWPDMRDCGFISNRIYDALASGAVVVSDRVEGLKEVFDDLVPTFTGPSELGEIVRSLLDDEDRRREISSEASKRIAAEHTFRQRSEQLVALLRPLLGKRHRDLEGNLLEL